MSLGNIGLQCLSTDAFLLIVSFVSGDRIHLLQAHRRFWVYRFRVLWYRDDQTRFPEVPNQVVQLRSPFVLRSWPKALRSLMCNVAFILEIDEVCRKLPSSLTNLEFYNVNSEINYTLLPLKLQTLCLRLMHCSKGTTQSINIAHLSDLRELTLEGRIFRLMTLSPALQRFTWTSEHDSIYSSSNMFFPNRNVLQMSTSLTHLEIPSDVVFQHLDPPQHLSLIFFRLHLEHAFFNTWHKLSHLQTLIIDSTLNRTSAKELPPTLTCLYQSQYLNQSIDLLHLTSLRTLGIYIERVKPIMVRLPNCLETLITTPFCIEHFLNLSNVRNLRIRAIDARVDNVPSFGLWSDNIRTLSRLILTCPKVELFHIDTFAMPVTFCEAWQTSVEWGNLDWHETNKLRDVQVRRPIFVRQPNNTCRMHFQCASCGSTTPLGLFSLWSNFSSLYRSSYYGHRFELSHLCVSCQEQMVCEACTHCRICGTH